MAKLSEKYETMVVYSLKNGEEQVEALKAKFSGILEEAEGVDLVSVNEWGKRRLAYPINYENDGYYVLYGFDSTPDFPKEFERVLNITEGVMRFLTVLRIDGPARPAPSEVEKPAEPVETAEITEEVAEEVQEEPVEEPQEEALEQQASTDNSEELQQEEQ